MMSLHSPEIPALEIQVFIKAHIYFPLTFAHGELWALSFILLYVNIQIHQLHLLKRRSSPMYTLNFVKTQVAETA